MGATSNADGSFSFANTTSVQFDFFASHGAYQSDFNVYDSSKKFVTTLFTELQGKDPGSSNKNDSKGTCPLTVKPCQTTFTFNKGISYFLGLTAKGDKTVYTDSAETSFNFVSGSETFAYYTNFKGNGSNLSQRSKQTLTAAPGTTLIAVNDSWKGDRDYNDFIVTAESVPEPGTIGALLGVGALGFMGRRRKAGAAEKA
ncbi:PEP-CTERM sorting domain-containing protein [Trichocoleus sp. FACHB-262]|uniref:PEP-CTERM sorting domain-containing protein n=1 Tax=Trichocoleus sp. FACHB-262 TaxID=2692869 RepID=UPI001688438D|nr:PEP-CTERM sorting domain-containing protein [Trichocoleus sp. FACHB-262]MBD2120079.1 PEP-CTERM sorting domain-containing protein [Trichocoleus sp. FACHB-262]